MENILDRVKLLMNYDSSLTLTENIQKTESRLITEAGEKLTQNAFKALKSILSADKAVFNLLKNDVSILKKFNNADDFLKELQFIESGGVSKIINKSDFVTLVKEFSKNKNISTKIKGVLVNSPAFDDVVKKIYPNGINNPANAKAMDVAKRYYERFGIAGQEFESMLKSRVNPKLSQGSLPSVIGKEMMMADKSAQGLMKNPVSAKAAADDFVQVVIIDSKKAGLNKSKFEKIGRTLGYYGAAGFERLKSLRQKMSLKKAILYGLAGYGTYEYLKTLFSDENEISILPPCVVNTEKIILTTTPSGDVVGVLKTTGVEEYDKVGGLKFYSNGRVWNGDNSKSGKYSCANNSEVKTESIIKRKINEQNVGNIQITWDTSKTDDSGTGSAKVGTGGGPTYKTAPSCEDVAAGTSVVKTNMKDGCVSTIQQKLKDLKYSTGVVDGKFGRRTKKAVNQFKLASNLPTNGEVDKKTYELLFSSGATSGEIQRLEPIKFPKTEIPQKLEPIPTPDFAKSDAESLAKAEKEGEFLPKGVPGPLNQLDYEPETKPVTEPERKRGGVRNLFRRNRR